MKNFPIVLFCFFSITGFGQNINDLRRHFEYDRSRDLNYRVYSTRDTMNATIFNIQYSSGNGLQVTAYLIIPQQKLRQYPAIIFLHGSGKNKDQFLGNALQLANESFASLLIDDPSARPPSQRMNYMNFTDPKKEVQIYTQTVVDIRRGIDLLEQNDKIDRDRIGFVGIDQGACSGAIVAGVENRILTYILMGCNPCLTCDLQKSTDPVFVKVRNNITSEQLSNFENTLKYFDAINYLCAHRSSTIFFQFAGLDPYLTSDKIDLLMHTTTEPKTQKSYPVAFSELILEPKAVYDREKWLKDHL